MKLLTITNLYPRPDNPTLGMFNAQLFREMAEYLTPGPKPSSGQESDLRSQTSDLRNICLVPEWRVWRWKAIREWKAPGESEPFKTRYLPVFYVPVLGRNWSGLTYSHSLNGVRSEIRAADVVYSTWLYPDGIAVANLSKTMGVPSWIMVMGSDTFHLRTSSRRNAILSACEKTEGLICVCNTLARRLVEEGVSADKVHVVPNGVDRDIFQYRDKKQASGMLPGDVSEGEWLSEVLEDRAELVLFVGNLVSVKAPDIMIKSFERFQKTTQSHKRVHLLFIGDGPMMSSVRECIRERGLEGMVHLLGRRSHEEVSLWMNLADCLCLCSRSEGMPNVVLESLASGLPVVATDVGACREMLGREQYGRIVDVDDTGEMAASLSEVLSVNVDRTSMASRHGKRSWSDQAKDILSLLKKR